MNILLSITRMENIVDIAVITLVIEASQCRVSSDYFGNQHSDNLFKMRGNIVSSILLFLNYNPFKIDVPQTDVKLKSFVFYNLSKEGIICISMLYNLLKEAIICISMLYNLFKEAIIH